MSAELSAGRTERLADERRARAGWTALLVLAVAFVSLAFCIQRDFWLTPCPGQIGKDHRLGDLIRAFGLETAICLGVIIPATAISRSIGFERRIQTLSLLIGRKKTAPAAFVLVLSLALPLAAAWLILDRFPNSGDEFSYLFEARTFAHFRLWETPPALGQHVIPYRTWISGSKWVSQYPPGWPLALAVGLLAGLPAWAVNAVFGAASVGALMVICLRVATPSATIVAAALYAMTPFYVMNAASLFSHVFSSLLILLLCLCLLSGEGASGPGRRVAAGAVLGALALTRYFDVAALIPSLLFWFFETPPKERAGAIGHVAAGFVPFAMLLGLYQFTITGSPFYSTYTVVHDPDTPVSLEPLRVAVGGLLIPVRLAELGLWTSPVLLVGYLACLALKFKDRRVDFYDLIFPGFALAYVLFADLGGNRYGPRYYMEAFPLMMVTIASAAPSISSRWGGAASHRAAAVASIACLLSFLAAWPLVTAGFQSDVAIREEPYRMAAAAALSNAIVIVETTGLGLVSADFVRNPPAMDDAQVVYAREETDAETLRKAFPTRSLWRYRRLSPDQAGELSPVTR